ncbi:hypothetical protein ELI_2296 [Eubacterium callanderi]|uniref:Uncharacterized protein n=1 Tax=Eubacterium callanderi TaxID=53442 RepID=E3GN07_9FIRM|nr:hypothetical protein ELI_2296 [Eubacterium callanderi]
MVMFYLLWNDFIISELF